MNPSKAEFMSIGFLWIFYMNVIARYTLGKVLLEIWIQKFYIEYEFFYSLGWVYLSGDIFKNLNDYKSNFVSWAVFQSIFLIWIDIYIYISILRVFAFVNHGFYKFLKTIPLCKNEITGERNKVQVRPSKNQSKQLFEKSDYRMFKQYAFTFHSMQ